MQSQLPSPQFVGPGAPPGRVCGPHVASIPPMPSAWPAPGPPCPRPRPLSRLFCASAVPRPPAELRLGEDIPVALSPTPLGGAALPLLVADCDAVMQMYIDANMPDRDPYWTCLWPSSIAMAQELAARPELVAGKRVADLGCGLGLGGVAAALAGAAEVVFLDREPLALQLALLNAALNGVATALGGDGAAAARAVAAAAVTAPGESGEDGSSAAAALRRLAEAAERDGGPGGAAVASAAAFDWAAPGAALLGRFDVVVACDVLYEAFSVEPVAAVAPRLLRPGGSLLLADPPNRAKANRDRFLELLGDRGFVAAEWGRREAAVWEAGAAAARGVPIEFLALREGAHGDTVGVKFYSKDG